MVQPISIRHLLRGEMLTREEVPRLLPHWEKLSQSSLEDNVYYSPRYAMALLESVAQSDDVRFAAVWRGQELIALMPLTSEGLQVPYLRAASQAWTTEYTFNSMPLLHRDHADAAAALLDVLETSNGHEWLLPSLNVEGATCRALTDVLDRRGAPWRFVGEYARATLQQGMTFDEHMQACVDSRRRRDLGRNMRRLKEAGHVQHRSFSSGAALEGAIRDFLVIEARGWKGERKTALACTHDTYMFAVRAFTGAAKNSICRADVLMLDGVSIAVSLTVFAGRTGFTVKCAYDEAYRKYSPGLLLEAEIIRSFYEEKWSDRLDSGTAGAHVIDSLWPGRVRVADLFFSLSRQNAEARLRGITAVEQLRRSMRSRAKTAASTLNVLGLASRISSASRAFRTGSASAGGATMAGSRDVGSPPLRAQGRAPAARPVRGARASGEAA